MWHNYKKWFSLIKALISSWRLLWQAQSKLSWILILNVRRIVGCDFFFSVWIFPLSHLSSFISGSPFDFAIYVFDHLSLIFFFLNHAIWTKLLLLLLPMFHLMKVSLLSLCVLHSYRQTEVGTITLNRSLLTTKPSYKHWKPWHTDSNTPLHNEFSNTNTLCLQILSFSQISAFNFIYTSFLMLY